MLLKATAPHPVGITGGRVLAAGETGDLDATDPHNASLIAAGHLTAVHGTEPVKKTPKPQPVEEN